MTRPDEHGAADSLQHAQGDEPLSACLPLGDDLRALLAAPRFRDCFRALFSQELASLHPGWPRELAADGAAHWWRRGDVLVELARAPGSHPLELGLSLPAESAVRLVDALLGAKTTSAIASASGQPSEAECGVLAYAAARLLASQQLPGWLLRDVRPTASVETPASAVVWPLSVRSSLGELQVSLWLAPHLLAESRLRHRLCISVAERAPPGALDAIGVGDVWICEGSTLTLTSEGLAGPVQLSVQGTDARLVGTLSRQRITSCRLLGSPHAYEGGLELVLAERGASLHELAQLAAGKSLAMPRTGEEAALRRNGRTLARGELVTWRGTVGLRVAVVCSAE